MVALTDREGETEADTVCVVDSVLAIENVSSRDEVVLRDTVLDDVRESLKG